MKLAIKSNDNRIHILALTILIISNICLYTVETLRLYFMLVMVALFLEFGKVLLQIKWPKVRIAPCIVWLIVIYAMFTYNGLLRLRFGTYNWDMMLFTCVQNMALYFGFKALISSGNWYESVKPIIITSTWISLIVLISNEWQNFAAGSIRVGDSLSGNVNTVGAYMGILSIFLALICNKEKGLFYWITFVATVGTMLLTGSKMSVIILAIDLLFFLNTSNHKARTFIFVSIAACAALFVIFTVPYFYEVIGSRIEDMFFQMFGIGQGHYSHSTEVREEMLAEGLRFMWDHPFFGGGEKYFGSKTLTGYEYSHCNYIELLVNFGVVGFFIYYIPIFENFLAIIKTKKWTGEIAKICIALLITRLILDWAMMTHSEPCIGYIPMIISFVYVDFIKSKSRMVNELCQN